MNRTPRPCTTCTHPNGWISCPECSRAYCFDHCVNHGCPYQGSRPTQYVGNPRLDAHLFHPWLWSRLYVVLHAVAILDLADSAQSRHMTLYAPVFGSSQCYYHYTLNGIGHQPHTSPPADTFDHLVTMMPEDHHQLLFTMVGIFVLRQRHSAPSHIGTPIHNLLPEVIRHRMQVANQPTTLIDTEGVNR